METTASTPTGTEKDPVPYRIDRLGRNNCLSHCSILPIISVSVEQTADKTPKSRLLGVFDQWESMKTNRTDAWQEWLPRIAEAGLSGDRQRLELMLVDIVRTLKRQCPGVSQELGQILANYATNPSSLRWKESGPPPVDADEGLALLRVSNDDSAPSPILPPGIAERVQQFLSERRDAGGLLREGFAPPSSLLLTGQPGTGKSMLARWLAAELRMPLVIQDLAASISSFLGKTGFNLRRTLDYARNRPCVLLLDEFDALAKRRDDQSEVGELKRIVNVLLKELEAWPIHSVLIAATNHPALLDPAIRRRFNIVLDLPLPGLTERQQILSRVASRFGDDLPPGVLMACGAALEGWSGSDLETAMQAAVRKHLVSNISMVRSLIDEVCRQADGDLQGKSIGTLIRAVQGSSKGEFTVRELATLFDKSASTIQHHLKRDAAHG